MLKKMLAGLIAKLKDQLESRTSVAPAMLTANETQSQSSFDFGPSLMHRDQRQQLNEGTSSDDTVPWDEFDRDMVVTEEEQARTDQIVRELWAKLQSDVEKAKLKAAKKAERQARRETRKEKRSGKPKISEDTDLSSPWVIDSEAQDIIRKGMEEGGEPQMEEIVVTAPAPEKKERIKANLEAFWTDYGSKIYEGASAYANPGRYIGGKILEELVRTQKAKKDTSGIGEIEDIEQEIRDSEREGQQVGGPIEEQMGELMPEEAPIPLETVEETTETQLPDEEMEDNYTDFVINEALDEEEEQYLLDKLSGDDQLSMIFDKVVETASEFSGSGSVEGPGSAVSDSIPARLSDGEFVITSKAANQIGPDTLQELMELAEQEANVGRQTAQTGGYVQEEDVEEEAIQPIISEKVLPTGRILPESEVSKRAKANADLLNPRMSLFASN
jgi:hypothetical protein